MRISREGRGEEFKGVVGGKEREVDQRRVYARGAANLMGRSDGMRAENLPVRGVGIKFVAW